MSPVARRDHRVPSSVQIAFSPWFLVTACLLLCTAAHLDAHPQTGRAWRGTRASAPMPNAEEKPPILDAPEAPPDPRPLDAPTKDARLDSKLQAVHGERETNLRERPHVVHPTTRDDPVRLDARPQVVHRKPDAELFLREKPQVVHGPPADGRANLPAKLQVIDVPTSDADENVAAKPQVVHPSNEPAVNVVEKPHVIDAKLKETDDERDGSRRLPTRPKDASASLQERPQVPPRVPALPTNGRPAPSKSSPRPPGEYGFSPGRMQVPANPPPPGCFYKSVRYEHGDAVVTPEPCLNCTCQKGVLVCYLRVCPVIGTTAPGCFSAREAGECCPNVYCSAKEKAEPAADADEYYDYPTADDDSSPSDQDQLSARTPPTPAHDRVVDHTTLPDATGTVTNAATPPSSERQNGTDSTSSTVTTQDGDDDKLVDVNDVTPTTLTADATEREQGGSTELKPRFEQKGTALSVADEPANSVGDGSDSVMFVTSSTPLPYELHHSLDLQDLDTIAGACLTDGSLYAEGSAMLSSDSCNYCYCIRGIQHCVQPKCHLAIDHCQPRFTSSFDCCPASYSCSENGTTTMTLTSSATTTTTASTTTASTAAPVIVPIQGCWKRGQLYRVGEAIPASTDCEACYCSPGGATCHRIECPPVALHCEPVIPKGHCCPTKYICTKSAHPLVPSLASQSADRTSGQGAPVFEVFGSHRNTEKYRAADYGALLQPVSATTTPVAQVAENVTDVKSPAENVGAYNAGQLDSNATLAAYNKTPSASSTTVENPSTDSQHRKQHVIYVPEQIRTESGGKILTEMKIVMNPGRNLSHPADRDDILLTPAFEGHEESSTVQDESSGLPPAASLEGLQFSELIDRVFLARQEENMKDDEAEVESPVYGHLYNASALGTSVVEARYPVDERDELRPVYSSPPVFTRKGMEANREMLAPLYGSPPTFVEGVSAPSAETITEAIHYEPAMSLDVNASSLSPVYAAASGEDATVPHLNNTLGIKGDSVLQSQQPLQQPSNKRQPDLSTAVNPRRESPGANSLILTTQLDETRAEARPTTLPMLEATTLPSEEVTSSTHESLARNSSEDKAETIPAEPRQSNSTFRTAEGATANATRNSAASVDSFTVATVLGEGATEGGTEESRTATDTIKVKVGNTLNVMDAEGFRDASGKPRLRKVEEDGVIFDAFPEHAMQLDPPEAKDLGAAPGLAESRAISPDGPPSNVRGISSVQKLVGKPTEGVVSGQENGQPEVITAPNVDFSKGESISIALSPGNSFQVASLLAFERPDIRTTTSTTPSVDTAPWAPLSTSNPGSRHAYESEGYAEATEESKRHSVLHSSFRIVPFLAEDAIFKPLGTETVTPNRTSPSALPRIAINSNPREPVKDNCFVGGRMFVNGELIKKEDPCDLCRCYYGQELCQKKSCPPPPSPACFTERIPGFCCPKYTCRPEDVLIPPERLDTSNETPWPGSFVVHQYRGSQFPSLPQRTTGPPSNTVAVTKSDVSDGHKLTTKRPFSLKGPPLLKAFFPKTSSTPAEMMVTTVSQEPEFRPTAKPTIELVTKRPGDPHSVWSILQVSGCNIYGRLYSVNEVVPELSSQCKACTCTALGVQCNQVC